MYKRWQGNSGQVSRVEEGRGLPPPPGPPPSPPPLRPPPPPPSGLSGLPSGLPFFGRLGDVLGGLETEDLLLILVLYLLYRESGDSELLFILGFLFLV